MNKYSFPAAVAAIALCVPLAAQAQTAMAYPGVIQPGMTQPGMAQPGMTQPTPIAYPGNQQQQQPGTMSGNQAMTAPGQPGAADYGADQAPPPYMPPMALVPVAPGSVWIPGHYNWDPQHQNYVWLAGEYAQPPRPNAQWMDGHWTQTPTSWVWMDGRWN